MIRVLLAALLVAGCTAGGGYATRPIETPAATAFEQPVAGLTDAELARFRIGDRFFTEPWLPAGSAAADRDGLGPTYVAAACSACHRRDGKSRAPWRGGPVVYRIPPDPAYGAQIQDRAVDGVPAEATLRVEVESVPFVYPDGRRVELLRPRYELVEPAFGDHVVALPFSARAAPALAGLGLLAAIPDDEILGGADPDDRDGDGVTGVARLVDGAVGRFGWTAGQATILDQVAVAFHEDLGITSPAHPTENCPAPQRACAAAPSGGAPEIAAARLADVAFYVAALAPPTRRDPDAVRDGEARFVELGCAACHRPRWKTGPAEVAALSEVEIEPYTDLLLHDLGPELAPTLVEPGVDGRWRTAPLWGIGRVSAVEPGAGFLHDGRARTLEEAILWHGGEAAASRDAFVALDAESRARVLAFLEDL
ncbi:MAG TPA: thiol oxidoreductase [Actinobacteria bacterium]|nr:thiol oxidoreductase [Actinomycetota bacterium]